MNYFKQPPSDFDVDFSFAMTAYRPEDFTGWDHLRACSGKNRNQLFTIKWTERTEAENTQMDTHGLVSHGALVAELDKKYWERSVESILTACHYGLVYAEISLALNRSMAMAAMKQWKAQQNFQAALREYGLMREEETASNIRSRKSEGLPIPSATAITAAMKILSPNSPSQFFRAIPLIMDEEEVPVTPRWKRWRPARKKPAPR